MTRLPPTPHALLPLGSHTFAFLYSATPRNSRPLPSLLASLKMYCSFAKMLFTSAGDFEVLSIWPHSLSWWRSRRWVRPWRWPCRRRTPNLFSFQKSHGTPKALSSTFLFQHFRQQKPSGFAQGHTARKYQVKPDLALWWTSLSHWHLDCRVCPWKVNTGSSARKVL